MKFNKEKCRILHLRKNDPMHHYILRKIQQLCKKECGGPGGDRNVPLHQRQQMRSHAVVMHFQRVEGGDSPPLSTGEATSGVLD